MRSFFRRGHFPRHTAVKLQVILLAVLMASLPLFSQPLALTLSDQEKNSVEYVTAKADPDQPGVHVLPSDAIPAAMAVAEESRLVFDAAPVLDESAYVANRGGEVVTQAMNQAAENLARQIQDALPAFTDDEGDAYVKADGAVAYTKPLANAPRAAVLDHGALLEITGNSIAWLRVSLDGEEAYIRKTDVSYDMIFVTTEETRYVQSTDDEELVIRAEPSETAEVIKEMWFADRVVELERSTEWSLIQAESGHEGYVLTHVLTPDVVFVMDSSTMYAVRELAVYAEPDTDSEKIKFFNKNDKLFRNGYSFDWSRVELADDRVGYVKMEDLTETNPFYRPPAPAYTPRPATSTPTYSYSNERIQAVINKAMSYVGCPYALGGSGYGGIDCSGLVMRAYESVGIYLPRLSRNYWGVGRAVSMSELQPGDIVAYDSLYTGNITHVAIYIGGGRVVHATNPWQGVRTGTVYFGNYRILTVRRVIG